MKKLAVNIGTFPGSCWTLLRRGITLEFIPGCRPANVGQYVLLSVTVDISSNSCLHIARLVNIYHFEIASENIRPAVSVIIQHPGRLEIRITINYMQFESFA